MTALDHRDEADPVPVHLPVQREPLAAEVLAARVIDKRPVFLSWARSRAECLALLRWLTRYGAHSTGFHLTHSPLYAGRLVARSP